MNYKKLNWLHSIMMHMMARMLQKKDPATLRNEDKELLATYGQVVDFKDARTIQPIVDKARA